MTSRRAITGVGGGEVLSEAACSGTLKSQRPKRRKQAVQVAMPDNEEDSVSQPKRARVSAGVLIWRCSLFVVGVVWDVIEEDCEGDRIEDIFWEMMDLSKDVGVESVKGSSEDIAASDSYRMRRLLRAVAW